MVKGKYDVLIRNGKDRFVVVPEKDFIAMQQRLQDEADFRSIEASKKHNLGRPLIPHEQVMREFGLTPRRRRRGG